MAEDNTPNPLATSGDYDAMSGYWHMVNSILGGAPAMRAVNGSGVTYSVPGPREPVAKLSQLSRNANVNQSPYLPKMENEGPSDYERRRVSAPFTNIYGDISDNLASKPFSKECQLDDKASDQLKKLAENIDGQGHNLHVFASTAFKAGLDKAIDWILVDFTKMPAGATLGQERSLGARPYWVHIPAERLLAVHSDFIAGQEVIYHARIYEPVTRQSGYGEECVERVRVLQRDAVTAPDQNGVERVTGYGPAYYEVYEAQKTQDGDKQKVVWILVDQGPITIGIIPLVDFTPGKRQGCSWVVDPPFRDIAYMQVEEFQQESNLKTIKELTAFPMLSGNGVSPEMENGQPVTVPVGPRAVLFAPMGGDGRFGNWTFIEPSAQSLTFLKDDLEALRTEMRNLGRQPLATANLTVVTTANVSMKAHNAVQAWALQLKDSLEQAWKITCMWLKTNEEPEVRVHTDFGVDFQADTELTTLQTTRAAKDLSQRTYWDELKRRGVLSDDFDADDEEEQLAEEQQGLEAEQPIDPVTGKPLVQAPQPPPKPRLVS